MVNFHQGCIALKNSTFNSRYNDTVDKFQLCSSFIKTLKCLHVPLHKRPEAAQLMLTKYLRPVPLVARVQLVRRGA